MHIESQLDSKGGLPGDDEEHPVSDIEVHSAHFFVR